MMSSVLTKSYGVSSLSAAFFAEPGLRQHEGIAPGVPLERAAEICERRDGAQAVVVALHRAVGQAQRERRVGIDAGAKHREQRRATSSPFLSSTASTSSSHCLRIWRASPSIARASWIIGSDDVDTTRAGRHRRAACAG